MLLLACSTSPLRAADNDFLYGTDKPNSAQELNRHQNLFEHSLLDLIMVKGSDPKPRTGYPFERKAKHDKAWKEYNWTQLMIKKLPWWQYGAGEFFGFEMRRTYKPAVDEYWRASAGGAGDKEKLSDYESDLIVSYLRWAPEPVFERFKREWIEITVPRSPEEHYLLQQKVRHCRAIIRAASRDYRSRVRWGTIDPKKEFAQVAFRAEALVSMDKNRLMPFYHEAEMTYIDMPAPPAGKPFIHRFSDQEHAVLTYLISGDPERAAFKADQKTADSEPSKMDGLVKKWQGKVMAQAKAYLKTPAKDGPGERTLDRFTPFEAAYIQWRLKRIDPSLWEHLVRIAGEADAAETAGDKGAGARMTSHLRKLVRKDLRSYVGGKPDTALPEWAAASLKPGQTFGTLFPAPKPPIPPKAPTIAEAIAKVFSEPVERAFIEHLLSSAPDRAAKEAELIKAAGDPSQAAIVAARWKPRILAAVKAQLDAPDAGVTAMLAKKNLIEADLLKYYCPHAASGVRIAGPETPLAYDQLVTMNAKSSAAANESRAEDVLAGAALEKASRSAELCRGQGPIDPNPPLPPPGPRPPTPPGPPAPPSTPVPGTPNITGPQAPAPLSFNDKMDRVAGASLGLGLFGLLAVAIGLGPVGFVLALVLGAAAGAAAVHFWP